LANDQKKKKKNLPSFLKGQGREKLRGEQAREGIRGLGGEAQIKI